MENIFIFATLNFKSVTYEKTNTPSHPSNSHNHPS